MSVSFINVRPQAVLSLVNISSELDKPLESDVTLIPVLGLPAEFDDKSPLLPLLPVGPDDECRRNDHPLLFRCHDLVSLNLSPQSLVQPRLQFL